MGEKEQAGRLVLDAQMVLEPVGDLLNEGTRGYFSVRHSRKIIA